MIDERFEVALRIAAGVLVAAILGLGGYFGYTVYRDRQAAAFADPAYRVIRALADQVRKSPNEPILRVRLGEAYAAAGQTQKAIEQLNAALQINPKHTGALLDLGQLAVMNGRYSEAEGYFQKVVDITEDSDVKDMSDRREIAFYQLGQLAFSQEDYEKAIGYFKQALRIRKDASDTYFYMAQALDALGDEAEAERQLEIALAFDPNFPQARFFLGELLLRRGERMKASDQFAHALRVDPEALEPREALDKFGSVEELLTEARGLEDDDLKAAIEVAHIARNVDPTSLDAALLRAELLAKSGDKKQALEAYESALELAPGDREIKAAIAKLKSEKTETGK